MNLSSADLLVLKSGLADLSDPRLSPAQRLMGRCYAADRTAFNAMSIEDLAQWRDALAADLSACSNSKMAVWANRHLEQINLQLQGKLARKGKL